MAVASTLGDITASVPPKQGWSWGDDVFLPVVRVGASFFLLGIGGRGSGIGGRGSGGEGEGGRFIPLIFSPSYFLSPLLEGAGG
ncbi:MAG: hypothetical protein JNJ94_15515 [Chlorobi bacterium]|nr:hypothetical protein [Chlorobiota bacterium]